MPSVTVSDDTTSYIESLRTQIKSAKVPSRKDVAEMAFAFIKTNESAFLEYTKSKKTNKSVV